MEESYRECHKIHEHLGGKIDGCQEFWSYKRDVTCSVCGCHKNFHRKIYANTECRFIHHFESHASVDGCQQFKPAGPAGDRCDTCGCKKGFHRFPFTT